MKTICVTGHRPAKLYGYNMKDPRYAAMQNLFENMLADEMGRENPQPLTAISGMALGVDQVFAMAVLSLKKKNWPIQLHAAVPCKGHSSKWPASSQKMYDRILAEADFVKIVTPAAYTPACMQKRNEYMVDMSEKVIAVWDGTNGGTANCVRYAQRKGKQILRIMPDTLERA